MEGGFPSGVGCRRKLHMKAAAVWKSLVFPVGAVLAKRRASVVIGGDSSRDCAP